MRARVWPAVAVSFGALLLLLPLFTSLVFHEAARIHEHTKTARDIYKKADDAVSDIQASINRGALIERSKEISSAENRISELERSTSEDIATLDGLLGSRQKPQLDALKQGLDEYWGSIRRNLAAARTQEEQTRFFSELENRPGK